MQLTTMGDDLRVTAAYLARQRAYFAARLEETERRVAESETQVVEDGAMLEVAQERVERLTREMTRVVRGETEGEMGGREAVARLQRELSGATDTREAVLRLWESSVRLLETRRVALKVVRQQITQLEETAVGERTNTRVPSLSFVRPSLAPPTTAMEYVSPDGGNDAFTKACDALVSVLRKYPSSSERHQYPVVTGACGVGRTRFGRRVAAHVASLVAATNPRQFDADGVAVSIDVGALCGKFPGEPEVWDVDRTSPNVLLAAAVFHAVYPDREVPSQITLPMITERVRDQWRARVVVLHLDNIEANVSVAKSILFACGQTTDWPFTAYEDNVVVLPIATGLAPSFWWFTAADWSSSRPTPVDLHLTPFALPAVSPLHPLGEPTALEQAFANAVGVPWDAYATWVEFRVLFRECGGWPGLCQDLVDVLTSTKREWRERPTRSEAHALYLAFTSKAMARFSRTKWFTLVGGKSACELSEAQTMVRRVLLCVLTDRDVLLSRKLSKGSSDVDFVAVAQSGLVGLAERGVDKSETKLVCSLVGVVCSNEACGGVIPMAERLGLGLGLESPFAAEVPVALGALYLRLVAAMEFRDEKLSVASLRPGARIQQVNEKDVVWVATPGEGLALGFGPTAAAVPMWNLVVVDSGMRGGDEVVHGRVMMEGGVDAAVPSRTNGTRKDAEARAAAVVLVMVVWVSHIAPRGQSPWSETALAAQLERMRTAARRVCAEELGAARRCVFRKPRRALNVHVVFDVFGEVASDVRLSHVGLRRNETLLLTTSAELARVVGASLSARLIYS